MTKGGARVASSEMPVGKGMGLSQHYETLCRINELGMTDITELMVALNKKFAWWDDPQNNAPKETCRSYIKELWRLGLVERLDGDGHVIMANGWNWPDSYRLEAPQCFSGCAHRHNASQSSGIFFSANSPNMP